MRSIAVLIITGVIALSTPLSAHPGHEYRIDGVITKLKSAFFDVEVKKGDATTFRIVPATEVFVNGNKGQASDIRVGVKALVEGVENEQGIVEAKLVKISG